MTPVRFKRASFPNEGLGFYRENGYVVVSDLWSDRELGAAGDAGERLSTALDGTWDVCMNPHQEMPVFRSLMAKAELLDLVEACAEGPVDGLQSQFMHGAPGYEGFGFHQDNYYIQSETTAFVTAWTALESIGPENGGLVIGPGSHREPVLPMGEPREDTGAHRDVTIVRRDVIFDESRLHKVALEVERGDLLFLHSHLIHGSGSNRTRDRFRRSFLFTYLRQGVAFRAGVGGKRQRIVLDRMATNDV